MAKRKKKEPIYIDENGYRRDPNRKGHPRICDARRKHDRGLCSNIAMKNGKCHKHGGASTGPKTLEGKRSIVMSTSLRTKTGERLPIWYDTLTTEEQEALNLVPTDAEELLMQDIQLTTIRERRMLMYIQTLQRFIEEEKTMDSVQESWKRFVRRNAKGKEILGETREDGSVVKATDYELVSKLIVKDDPRKHIQEIEEALTRVQGHKHKLIDLLHRLSTGNIDNADGSLKQLNNILGNMRALHDRADKRAEIDKQIEEERAAKQAAEQEEQDA